MVCATEVRLLLLVVDQLMAHVGSVLRSDWAKSSPRFISRLFGGLAATIRQCISRPSGFPSFLLETLVWGGVCVLCRV
jgi:hypothetical protein